MLTENRMEREIKFRMWVKGEIFGYERLTKKGWESMCPFLNPVNFERWTPTVFSSSIEGFRDQYTGKKDEQGNEIYDNDIVQDLEGNIFIVEWNDDTVKWQLSDGRDLNDGDTYSIFLLVVGNVYDNKNLIPKCN